MKQIQKRFDELLEMAEAISGTREEREVRVANRAQNMLEPTKYHSATKISIDGTLYYQWRTSVQSLLFQVFGETHPTYGRFAQDSQKSSFNLPSDFRYFLSLFLSAKNDFEGGFLFKLRSLVHADVFSNELEQAEYFLKEGYKVPAAVIAGTVLESTLRELCLQHQVTIFDQAGVDITLRAKLDRMNSELAKVGSFNKTRQKQITSWADIRNNAAHGKPEEFDEGQVRDMISGITDFVAQALE